MSIIRSVARAFPPYYTSQRELTAALMSLWRQQPFNASRLHSLHDHMQVEGRHHAVSLETLTQLDTFSKSNDAYLQCSVPLAAQVASRALDQAGLSPADIDHLFFVTVTGVATPSVDALLCNRLPFSPGIKRTPIFGLGCAAGAASIARAGDYVRGFPTHRALVVSVELCSLTLQRNDCSVANYIASGLFGDGATAAVIEGEQCAPASQAPTAMPSKAPRIVATASHLYANTEAMLGWRVSSDGFTIMLSGEIPALLGETMRELVDSFLHTHHIDRSQISHWVCHPGGPKVLETIAQALSLERSALSVTHESLAKYGNLSSSSVLLVLEDTMAQSPADGSYGLMMAFGPGFAVEMVLLQW